MTEAEGRGFDLARFEIDLAQAGASLAALANGPGQVAADALARGFAEAGREIETALLRAAKTGEVSFETLFRRILEDFARLAAEGVIGALGLPGAQRGSAPGAASIVFNMTGGADGASLFAQQGRIGQLIAGALKSGGRYS